VLQLALETALNWEIGSGEKIKERSCHEKALGFCKYYIA
jgi:hypothetical protein